VPTECGVPGRILRPEPLAWMAVVLFLYWSPLYRRYVAWHYGPESTAYRVWMRLRIPLSLFVLALGVSSAL
jgi:hypothetical protein